MATSPALKGVCRTWEDHLWVLVSIACEERLSRGLEAIERECFWEGGLGALEGNASAAVDGATEQRVDEDAWEDDKVAVRVREATLNVFATDESASVQVRVFFFWS